MDKAIDSEQAFQFVKMLVELGGTHYLDSDLIIHSACNDAPVGVVTGTPPKKRPLAVFKQGMSVGEYVVLNPFTDVLGNSPERAWFMNKMRAFPGSIIGHLVHRMIEIGIAKDKDAGYKANKYVSKWVDKMDEKMLDEADRISAPAWATIFYDRTKRIAQLQSNIGTEDLKAELKTKIRKSTWPIFTEMVRTLLGLGTKKPESLMYEATIVSIPKLDAILHLLMDVLNRLDEPIKTFTEIEIPIKELNEHVKHISAYREATKWFASATSTDSNDTAVVDTAAPWQTQPKAAGGVGSDGTVVKVEEVVPVGSTGSSPSCDAATIAALTPVGVIYNDRFGRPGEQMGTIVNPTYGGYGSQIIDNTPSPISELRPW